MSNGRVVVQRGVSQGGRLQFAALNIKPKLNMAELQH